MTEGKVKTANFYSIDRKGKSFVATANFHILSRPGRRSNPIPTAPDEEEEPLKPGTKEDPSKKKKKKSQYEVTC
jgi:hypothetical protein